jgi:acetyltransferase-like isoleucine patch superfamily enzyme
MEGAKAVFEVMAGAEGYFYAFVQKNERIQVGFPIGLVSSTQLTEEELRELKSKFMKKPHNTDLESAGMTNMSVGALRIFEGLDEETKEKISNHFREIGFVRERDLRSKLTSIQSHGNKLSQNSINGWKSGLNESEGLPSIYFVGGGFGALQALDVLLKNHEFHLSGYFSDSKFNILDEIGIAKIGSCNEDDYRTFIHQESAQNFVITVGSSPEFRFNQFTILSQLGAHLPNIIHPSTVIGKNVEIGVGNLIFGNVHIGADARIGNSNLISSNSTFEHHNVLGDGNCFGPQVATSGNVKIGDRCRFGSGIIVEPSIEIASEVTIASNVTITANIEMKCTVKAISNLRVTRE